MKNKFLVLLILGVCIFSCQKVEQKKDAPKAEVNQEEVSIYNTSLIDQNKNYLSQETLTKYVKNGNSLEITNDFPEPFNRLIFDKVIAYEFDGSEEPYPSIIMKTGEFAPVISKQQQLSREQIESFIKTLTNNENYGEATASCFMPHLGLVFYEQEDVKFEINICLDCNYLISTQTIPATVHNKIKFQDGTEYGARGFSDKGKQGIIELSKDINHKYGQRLIESK